MSVGDSRIGWNHRTHTKKNSRLSSQQRISKSLYFSSKDVSHFTRAPRPHFIGRRGYFFIPIIPSYQNNIPNVNMYITVISYPVIFGTKLRHYKSAIHSHPKPGFWHPFIHIPTLIFETNLTSLIMT
jgi:hypothetical protein